MRAKKDPLSQYRLNNTFPHNPTQVMYKRFLKVPHTGLDETKSSLTEMKKIFNKPLSTIYFED